MPVTSPNSSAINWASRRLITEKGININSILIEVLGAVAEQEREKILERQKEGIAAMPIVDGKKVSTKTGRAMGNPGKDLKEFPKFFEKTKNGELSVSESCRQLGISRTHWYRLCKGAS